MLNNSTGDNRPRPLPSSLLPPPPKQLSRVSTGTTEFASASGSGRSPDMSDEESVDLSPQDHGSPAESVKSSSARGGAIKSESEGVAGADSSAAANMPVQKRRRVTRACDECRRKKIKCDGKQPCTHCSVYSYGNTNLFLFICFLGLSFALLCWLASHPSWCC